MNLLQFNHISHVSCLPLSERISIWWCSIFLYFSYRPCAFKSDGLVFRQHLVIIVIRTLIRASWIFLSRTMRTFFWIWTSMFTPRITGHGVRSRSWIYRILLAIMACCCSVYFRLGHLNLIQSIPNSVSFHALSKLLSMFPNVTIISTHDCRSQIFSARAFFA